MINTGDSNDLYSRAFVKIVSLHRDSFYPSLLIEDKPDFDILKRRINYMIVASRFFLVAIVMGFILLVAKIVFE